MLLSLVASRVVYLSCVQLSVRLLPVAQEPSIRWWRCRRRTWRWPRSWRRPTRKSPLCRRVCVWGGWEHRRYIRGVKLPLNALFCHGRTTHARPHTISRIRTHANTHAYQFTLYPYPDTPSVVPDLPPLPSPNQPPCRTPLPHRHHPAHTHTHTHKENYVIQVTAAGVKGARGGDGTAAGETTFVYTGDRWSSAPDKLKSHDFQYWYPLAFNDSVSPPTIEPMKWVDSIIIHV